MQPLVASKLKELYQKFRELSPWKDWHKDFLSEVQYFMQLSEQEFITPENQEKLWRAKGVSSLGPGEAVSVTGAYTDQQIVALLLSLRETEVAKDPVSRSRYVKENFDRIINLVRKKHSQQRPLAKLSRVFTVLFPYDVHTCYSWASLRDVQELVLGSNKYEYAEGAVMVRARLKEVLGEEGGLEESVWRAMFCWWLHKEHDTILREDDPEAEPSVIPAVADTDDRLLSIWPASKQRKGLQAIANYQDALRMVIAAARGGASPDDIVETMKDNADFSGYKAKTCRVIFNLVRTFGFLENREGLWYPSDDGEQLVQYDPADVLVEKLLVQVYGMAHLLKEVGDAQPVPKKVLHDFLKSLWGGWTTDFMPSALAAWLRSMGLLALDATGSYVLTDYGAYWNSRTPAKEDIPKAAPVILAGDLYQNEEPGVAAASDLEGLPFETVWQSFQNDDGVKGFVFAREQVEALHLAWHCNPQKRFVLLSGLSGTGKTALLFHYARIYCHMKGIDAEQHRAVIAVSPDWREPSGLLGYFNALHADPTFQAEPALRTVIAASANPHLPYFLILDEMNLARVERYFAPFLSSMETGERLLLHAHQETVNDVPPTMAWPRNLFVGGTVNMDETTHPFSDKVLDRAFTLEFWDVQLVEFFSKRQSSMNAECRAKVEFLLLEMNQRLFKVRRHFGYRTAGEVLDFLDAAENLSAPEGPRFQNLLDQALFSKVLPRIRGEESPALIEVLKGLTKLCSESNLRQCAAKLTGMQERLKSTGVTRFWS